MGAVDTDGTTPNDTARASGIRCAATVANNGSLCCSTREEEQTMSTENIIFTGVALYMLGMIGVGYYASTKARSVSEFMVAGTRPVAAGLLYDRDGHMVWWCHDARRRRRSLRPRHAWRDCGPLGWCARIVPDRSILCPIVPPHAHHYGRRFHGAALRQNCRGWHHGHYGRFQCHVGGGHARRPLV